MRYVLKWPQRVCVTVLTAMSTALLTPESVLDQHQDQQFRVSCIRVHPPWFCIPHITLSELSPLFQSPAPSLLRGLKLIDGLENTNGLLPSFTRQPLVAYLGQPPPTDMATPPPLIHMPSPPDIPNRSPLTWYDTTVWSKQRYFLHEKESHTHMIFFLHEPSRIMRSFCCLVVCFRVVFHLLSCLMSALASVNFFPLKDDLGQKGQGTSLLPAIITGRGGGHLWGVTHPWGG